LTTRELGLMALPALVALAGGVLAALWYPVFWSVQLAGRA
jgi:hypothetical protein